MKVKKIHIKIRKLDDALTDAGKAFEKLAEGKTVQKKSALYFSNIKDFRKVLTEKRLELLKTIKDRKPSSIYELAKMVNRDLKNVLQDVRYFEELGIVEIIESGGKKVPEVHYDIIELQVAI
jgi:predicted transcriptional regulator